MIHDRAKWGFTTTKVGDPIVRNWYFVTGFVVFVVVLMVLCMRQAVATTDSNNTDVVPIVLIFIMMVSYGIYASYLEFLGVVLMRREITYPVRVGGEVFLPLFRRTVRASEVLQSSSLRLPRGLYVVYLSGEFGEANIIFDTKGNRDRFFAVVGKLYPNIKIYRWT